LKAELEEQRGCGGGGGGITIATGPKPPPTLRLPSPLSDHRRSEPTLLATNSMPTTSYFDNQVMNTTITSSSPATPLHQQSRWSQSLGEETRNLRVVEMLGSDMDIKLAFRHVESQAQTSLQCQRAIFWLVDSDNSRLWAPSMGANVIIPPGSGFPGYCAQNGEVVRVDEAQEDSRYTIEVSEGHLL